MIYDCFTFFNELDLLELRLETLSGIVDRFVLVESDRAFTGTPKKLYFETNKQRYLPYLDKIIHIIIEDMPETDNPWDREHFQRNAILRGLKSSLPGDLILLSDVDEIPRPETLLLLFSDGRCLSLLDRHPLVLTQNIYYYQVNMIDNEHWFGTIVIRKKNFNMSPEELRTLRFRLPRVRNGGWHFSYMGGAKQVAKKLNSIVATDDNTPENNDLSLLEYKVAQGINILTHRGSDTFINSKMDESYPIPIFSWLERHPEYFRPPSAEESTMNPSQLPRLLSHIVYWEWFVRRQRFHRRMNWD